MEWEHAGIGVVDASGAWMVMTATHFSNYDCNDPISPPEGIDDNEDYIFFKSSDLQADLSDIVRQAIILAVGMKPLCSEDCRGLCPDCGVNLNKQSCRCASEKIDPRWEGLKKLHNG